MPRAPRFASHRSIIITINHKLLRRGAALPSASPALWPAPRRSEPRKSRAAATSSWLRRRDPSHNGPVQTCRSASSLTAATQWLPLGPASSDFLFKGVVAGRGESAAGAAATHRSIIYNPRPPMIQASQDSSAPLLPGSQGGDCSCRVASGNQF